MCPYRNTGRGKDSRWFIGNYRCKEKDGRWWKGDNSRVATPENTIKQGFEFDDLHTSAD